MPTSHQPFLQGVDHIGLGSDFDGGITSYTDVANLGKYTVALVCKKQSGTTEDNCLDDPFTEEEAHKILGLNSLRVLRSALN